MRRGRDMDGRVRLACKREYGSWGRDGREMSVQRKGKEQGDGRNV